MPYPPQQQNTGLYVPTTSVWDMGLISDIDTNSIEFKDLLVRLYQNINNIVLALNVKDSAYYIEEEFVNGQQFFNPASTDPLQLRSDFRKTINIGAVGAGVTTVAHGIPFTTTYTATRIYGTATDSIGLNYYPLPWASAAGATNIELRADGTNVIITNNSGVAFTRCIVVLEYLKN